MILKENMPILTAMAEALLEYETIEAEDIEILMQGKKIARVPLEKSARSGQRKPNVTAAKEEIPQKNSNPLIDLSKSVKA